MREPAWYVSKPIRVQAIQYTGKNGPTVKAWVNGNLIHTHDDGRTCKLMDTPEHHVAEHGDKSWAYMVGEHPEAGTIIEFCDRTHPLETWFESKNGAGTQGWNWIKEPTWGTDVIAAVYVYLHESWSGVKRGYWIVRGGQGEFYPIDDLTFRNRYAPDHEEDSSSR